MLTRTSCGAHSTNVRGLLRHSTGGISVMIPRCRHVLLCRHRRLRVADALFSSTWRRPAVSDITAGFLLILEAKPVAMAGGRLCLLCLLYFDAGPVPRCWGWCLVVVVHFFVVFASCHWPGLSRHFCGPPGGNFAFIISYDLAF